MEINNKNDKIDSIVNSINIINNSNRYEQKTDNNINNESKIKTNNNPFKILNNLPYTSRKLEYNNNIHFQSTSTNKSTIDYENKNEKLTIDPSYINSNISLSLNSKNNLSTIKINPFSKEEWSILFTNNNLDIIDNSRLVTSLKIGIPPEIRGRVWMLLSQSFRTYKEKNDIKYKNLLKEKNEYVDDLIKRDINRTILNKDKLNKVKSDPKKLFNVLKAYSVIDKEVSYCQGTNSIVATILLCIGKEEFCFWTFYNLMQKNQWRNFFIDKTPKLLRMIDMLKENLKKKLKDLYEYFQEINFTDYYIDVIFSQFFLTLFTYYCPIDLSLRIIDLFWVYEENVIINSIINILILMKEKMKKMDNEELVAYLKKDIIFDAVEKYGVDYIISLL